jgi:hypothetical protein
MVLLIGGIFIGFLTILALSSLGWFSVILALWAVAMIAAGIQQLRNGRPDDWPTPDELRHRMDSDSAGTRNTGQSKAD